MNASGKIDKNAAPTVTTEPVSKYATLHEQGVKIKDELIDFIVDTISLGVQDTKTYFNRNEELNLITSDNQQNVGYVKGQNAVAIPISFYREFEGLTPPYDFDSPDYIIGRLVGLPEQISLRSYLRNIGREETVHFFQDIGDVHLKSSLTDSVNYLSPIDRYICDAEVEARSVVDEIAKVNDETPIWENIDKSLKENYPDKYGKTIDVLLELSK